MHIIGTAGHVDHGKSSLVQALTGTNPDRWLEEQRRGMTLDLGFALLQFADGTEAGIVDVPGHERFLHNMLAGAAGMELLLLVVDALEGVRPQTLEHLQILQYLNVRDAIIVLTKCDLLEPLDLQRRIEHIRGQLRETMVENARIIAVSSLTRENIPLLQEAIHQSLLRLPPRPLDAPAYLPVDRVFTLPGLGTIVTGTLMQGRIATGESFALQPLGRSVRVRSLQCFNRKHDRVEAGAGVANNVPNVSANEIRRGEMLVASQFVPAQAFTVQFTPVRDALAILRRRNAVRAYVGSAEILGTLVLEDVPGDARAQTAQLFLKVPAVAYPGMPFVVRRLSPKNLLGGGTIGAELAGRDDVSDTKADRVFDALLQAQEIVLTAEEIALATNMQVDAVEQRLAQLVENGEVLALARPAAYVEISKAATLLDHAIAFMRERQTAEPWILGTTSLAVSRALTTSEVLLVRILTAYAHEGKIALRAGYFSTVDHVPVLTPEQRAFFDACMPQDAANPFVPAELAGVVAEIKRSRVNGVGKAFDTLLGRGGLVKVGEHLYRGRQIAAIRARVESFLRANGRMTMAQFRDIVGTSRKYAVPLLEWFDARGITVRSGDFRMLRNSGG